MGKSELDKALEKAKYASLPLPRAKSEPTTIFSFIDGHLFIVRNAHSCLPDPPLKVTEDGSVDTIEFTREFNFELKGLVSFIAKLFGMGNAKGDLETKNVTSATVQMGGLSHHTIETGELVDYLLKSKPSACLRDIMDKDHLTIVAALQAKTFTYTFKNAKGLAVQLSAPEVQGLFSASASVSVQVTNEGKIVVNSPCYVGVVTWNGKTIARELEKARKASARPGFRAFRPAGALENALAPADVFDMRAQSLGIRNPPAAKKKRK